MKKNFCACCGEPNPALLIKSKKNTYCHNCKDENCVAFEEHKIIRFARIGHFLFTNAVGMQQSIEVFSSKDSNKKTTEVK